MEQLVFDLEHRPSHGRDDYLVTPANELAVRWIDRWPDWPGPVLALCGPPGAGKTHLTEVWRAAAGAVRIPPRALGSADPLGLIGDSGAWSLDGVDAVLEARPELEPRLLHLLNLIHERGGHLLITGRSAPARWPVGLPDLHSRLAAVPVAALGPPDDDLIAAILIKLFADRQLQVGGEVIRYLLPRMERSLSAAGRLVDAIDRAALTRHRQITIALVRDVMEGLDPGDVRNSTDD